MRLTVLGTSAVYPGPGEACSGFLVREGNTNLLVDCGTGVLNNLQRHIDLRSISDIVVTHMHSDHFFDLVPYRYALRYGLEKNEDSQPRLHLPPGGTEALRQVVSPFAESETFWSEAFHLSEYDPARLLRLGSLALKFVAVRHYIPTYAVTITGAKKLAYSADSGPCPELVQVAQGADLFLCNIGACLEGKETSLWGHLRPEEAGALAREAAVKHLLLSHLWPACNRSLSLEKAAEAFGGLVEFADPQHTYEL